ncbi:MAG: hypothetical protein WC677_04060 [Clostridia bacterium]|jgi:hypothetical protein
MKKFKKISLLLVVCMIISLIPAIPNYATANTYEAESIPPNVISGTAETAPVSGASGGYVVTGIGGDESSWLEFNNIYVPTAGIYKVVIYYYSNVNRNGYARVNNDTITNILFLGKGTEEGTKTITVYLQSGNNSLKIFRNSDATADIDKIVVDTSSFTSFEAEETANILQDCSITYKPGASGNYIVSNVGNGNTLQINNIYVENDGVYSIPIYYYSDTVKNGYYSINGENDTYISFPSMGDLTTEGVKSISVSFKSGYNTIRFYNSSAAMPYFDKIDVANAVENYYTTDEAEDPSNETTGTTYSLPACSNGEYIGDLGYEDTLQINFYGDVGAGIYNFGIYYLSSAATSGCKYSINDGDPIDIDFAVTGSSIVSVKYISGYLHDGYNSIKFFNSTGSMVDIDRVCRIGDPYFIKNYNFENGTGTTPDSWTFEHSQSQSTMTWANGVGQDESSCVVITNTGISNSGIRQEIAGLQPLTYYTVKAWVKAENIVFSNGTQIGANLSVKPSADANVPVEFEWFNYSTPIQPSGSFDWTEIQLDFLSSKTGKIDVTCRLGNKYNEWVTGKIYIDNMSIVRDYAMSSYMGDHVNVHVKASDVAASGITGSEMNTWISNLDSVYQEYHELVGDYPTFYGQDNMNVCSVDFAHTNGVSPLWSGQPISWRQTGIESALEKIKDGDWFFGVLHEMGHGFDNNAWLWDGELSANFKMYCAFRALPAGVITTGSSYNLLTYTGSDGLEEFYREGRDCGGNYENTIGNSVPTFHHDALTYCLIRVVKAFAATSESNWVSGSNWKSCFTQTYQYMKANVDPDASKWYKLTTFLDILQQKYDDATIYSTGNEVMDALFVSDHEYNVTKDFYNTEGYNYYSYNVANNWTEHGINLGTKNVGKLHVAFDATPLQNGIDGAINYADSSTDVAGFGDLAMQVRFHPSGYLDVRNGSSFMRTNAVNYTANTKYHIDIYADMDAAIYSVYVTPDGGSKTLLAGDYSFRTGAPATNDVGQLFLDSDDGTDCNFKVANHEISYDSSSTPEYLSNGINLGSSNTGIRTVKFDVVPQQSNIDASVDYADTSTTVAGFNDFAMQVRFNPSGYFDVRNGGSFTKSTTVNYTADIRYHVRIVANMNAYTYSVYITPPGGSETQIASNYAFRTGCPTTNDIGKLFVVSESADDLFRLYNHVIT